MTIKEVLRYNTTIKSIVDDGMEITPLVKFRLLGMLKQFEPVIENFETIRNELIYKYGEPTVDGRYSIIMPIRENFENDDDYQNALKEYENTINTVNGELDTIVNSEADLKLRKFKCTDIMDAGLSADYLLELYDLIEE